MIIQADNCLNFISQVWRKSSKKSCNHNCLNKIM